MIKKELTDILMPSLLYLSFLLVVPLFYIFNLPLTMIYHFPFIKVFRVIQQAGENDYITALTFIFAVVIYLIAVKYGLDCFRNEYKDRAFEYLFSFPMTRWSILRKKLFPRLGMLLTLIFVYEGLAIAYILPLRSLQGALFFFFDPVFFPFSVLLIFFIGLFTSLFEQKDWMAVVSLFAFIGMALFSIAFSRFLVFLFPELAQQWFRHGLGFIGGNLLLVFILGIPFFMVYRRFDMKPLNIHGRRYARWALPLLGVGIIGSVVMLI